VNTIYIYILYGITIMAHTGLQSKENRIADEYFIMSTLLSGLVVRVRGYRAEMYCDSCEVRTEFIYVM
jgi:hypothetical protein